MQTDYADACPIATVALEVSSTSQQMRIACAEVFERWIAAGAARFHAAGVTESTARELTIGMLCALEGAFVLARASRSTEPLRIAGEMTARTVERALAEPDRSRCPRGGCRGTRPRGGYRGTRPPSAPGSEAGPRGAAMPRTRIAFSPSESFSLPSVEETSRPVSSRTRSKR